MLEIIGPTLPDLRSQIDVNHEEMSRALFGKAAGFFIGSVADGILHEVRTLYSCLNNCHFNHKNTSFTRSEVYLVDILQVHRSSNCARHICSDGCWSCNTMGDQPAFHGVDAVFNWRW